ncbi:hypothetical protein VTK56DRAFT_6822 [Thermocarpiscus australiensis]
MKWDQGRRRRLPRRGAQGEPDILPAGAFVLPVYPPARVQPGARAGWLIGGSRHAAKFICVGFSKNGLAAQGAAYRTKAIEERCGNVEQPGRGPPKRPCSGPGSLPAFALLRLLFLVCPPARVQPGARAGGLRGGWRHAAKLIWALWGLAASHTEPPTLRPRSPTLHLPPGYRGSRPAYPVPQLAYPAP